jgi:hypothetical protein
LPKLAADRLGSLGIAIAASLALLAGSFVRLWGDAGSALGGKMLEATLTEPLWGTALGWHVAGFVAALLLVHSLFGLLAWGLARLSKAALPASPNGLRSWTLIWFLGLTAWVFIANAAWFPRSSLGRPYAGWVQFSLYGVSVFEVATFCLFALLAVTLIGSVARLRAPGVATALAVLVAFAGVGVVSFAVRGDAHAPGDPNRPHVIFIGLDSVRADAVGRGGAATLTPAIDRFLASSTRFTDTVTPLARTFPAWVSIVSGRHPHTTGAVMNLLPRELIDEGETLPTLLRDIGYRAVYATDEVRFSNLDESYGFDEMLAPPIGSADFLLGFFGDAPLANLIVNTRAGKWLFPYAYANRGFAVTYEPETFVERLDAELELDRPTFLAVHFTLVHWPYTWASAREHETGEDAADIRNKYGDALAQLDRQFGDFLSLLERRGALASSLVVVLSDHGESLGEAPPVIDEAASPHDSGPRELFGHGTNLFAEDQYRVVLAMRSYGSLLLPTTAGGALDVPASLEDLAPTLADAFGLEPELPFDGQSLLPALRGAALASSAARVRFIETEFNPPGLAPGDIVSSALLGGAAYYRIDPRTDRVLVREQYLDEILANRQYGAARAGQLLASVPSRDGQTQQLVLARSDGAHATWLSGPPAADGDPEAFELWTALAGRFESVRARLVTEPPPP